MAPRWIKSFAGAWMFYTILPKWPFVNPEFKRIARFAPLIGLFIGLIQSCSWVLLSKFNWPKESIVLITLSIGYWITGGLHLDGLIDTADGIAAGKDKLKEAMKDSRVGAIGVQVFALILAIQIACLLKIDIFTPLIIPIATFWGRVSPLWAIGNFKYLHREEQGNFHKKNWVNYLNELTPSILTIVFICFILLFKSITINGYYLLLFISLGIIPTFIIPELLGKRLGGHSGDSYGASVVIVETCILLFSAIIL